MFIEQAVFLTQNRGRRFVRRPFCCTAPMESETTYASAVNSTQTQCPLSLWIAATNAASRFINS